MFYMIIYSYLLSKNNGNKQLNVNKHSIQHNQALNYINFQHNYHQDKTLLSHILLILSIHPILPEFWFGLVLYASFFA